MDPQVDTAPRPFRDVARGSAEVGELLHRAQHLLGGAALRMSRWEAGIKR